MNLLYCLRRARDRYGSSTATYRGDQPIAWRDLWVRCERIAAFLRDLGLQRGDRMSLLLENSVEFLELYYSALIAGVIVVPMNTRWTPADIEFTIRDSGSVALAVDDRFVTMAAQLPRLANTIYAGTGSCPDGMVALAASESAHTFVEPEPQDLVGLFYTSGTTGGPKGVMLSHR